MEVKRTLLDNGLKQLVQMQDDSLIVLVGGRDWYYPTSVAEGIKKMLERDWDATLDTLADLVLDK